MSSDLKRELDDVRDEVHTGLREVRELVEQSRSAMFRMESQLATSDPSSSLRVADALERVTAMADNTRKRQSWLVGLVMVQSVVLICAIAWFSLQHDLTPPAASIAEPPQPPATLSTLTETNAKPATAAIQPTLQDQHDTSPRKRRPPKRSHAAR